MKLLCILVALCIATSVLFACGNKQKDSFPNLSVNDFEQLIRRENTQILDVRTPAEYGEGHIPGSIHIDVLGKLFADSAATLLDKAHPVAVYCRSGRRSRNAARILVEQGYTVYNLDKGFEDWKKAGKATEKAD